MDSAAVPNLELHLHLNCSPRYDVVRVIDPSVTRLDAGGRAIYVPYNTTAHHERVSGDGYSFRRVERVQDVVAPIQ
jgi:hypothetical protein